ncbi:signal transduction histidine kinase [Paucibacter oligotrophus]|uniref:histidine kinase n=1 Tax=Roseateles oligotrophus TaxID=1769250 RepID=A0A840L4G4_9BURK|nr:HAMP domain-containing sensor histidine kinase [Roseateles oligotrophus]MBB4841723.1 signal transduction histidine kinase [Roseateles oligotrophus]
MPSPSPSSSPPAQDSAAKPVEGAAAAQLKLRRWVHELNTPLGVILMANSVQKQQLDDLRRQLDPQQAGAAGLLAELQEANEMIQASVQLAIQLLTAPAAGQPSEGPALNLAETVAQVIALQRARHGGVELQISLDIAPNLRLMSEASDWHLLIGNLISNSVAHGFQGRKGGQIRIEARQLPNANLYLRYADDGVGLSEQARQSLFNNGFSTRLGQGHQGLGMGIVQDLVSNKLGGRMQVLPSSQGAQFSFELPAKVFQAE